jgi:hypothetical protein
MNWEQRNLYCKIKCCQLSAEDKRILFKKFLQKLPKKTKTTNESKDNDQSKNNKTQKNQKNNDLKQKDQQKEKGKESTQKRDTTNDFDWFLNYPITPEMQQHSKLSTPLALKVFSLLKSYLVNFNLGQEIPTDSTDSKLNNRPPAKYSFNYILNKMANSKPKFLTDFILEANPEFDQSNPIPFKVLVETLKGLVAKFTTVLFTQLDYIHIFRSHYSIPPYSTNNRKKVAINMAHLHLYLNHTYKTINFEKFIEKLNIKPLHFTLNFDIDYTADKLLFDIQNDNRFNIKVTLNIPAKKFEDDFKIPSLKPHTQTYET